MATKYFNVKNGLTTGGVLIADGNVTLGNVANVHISGGTNGYLLRTNGSGTLSWVDPESTQSVAPMPIVIGVGETVIVPDNYQGLFGTTITVNGTLDIDGILIDVSGQGAAGSNSQVQFNDQGDPAGQNGFTFNKTSGNLNVPGSINAGTFFKFSAYSKAELGAITGVLGQLAVLNDSNPIGQLVFWDATNSRWAYVGDNAAITSR